MSDKEISGRKTCEVCEGSGQICSFKGVSRFVLTWEDCPLCGGVGFTILEADEKKTTNTSEKDQT